MFGGGHFLCGIRVRFFFTLFVDYARHYSYLILLTFRGGTKVLREPRQGGISFLLVDRARGTSFGKLPGVLWINFAIIII